MDRDVPVRSGPGPGFGFSGPGFPLPSGFEIFRSGFSPPVRVLFFPVQSGPGLKRKSGPGFHLQSGFHFFLVRSGPGFVFNAFCL